MRPGLAMIAFGVLLTAATAAPPPADLIPPGATGIGNMNGLTWFDSALSPQALDAFYRGVLPRHGFRPAADVRSGGTLSFYFFGGKGGASCSRPRARPPASC
jgi:hypothetical protein